MQVISALVLFLFTYNSYASCGQVDCRLFCIQKENRALKKKIDALKSSSDYLDYTEPDNINNNTKPDSIEPAKYLVASSELKPEIKYEAEVNKKDDTIAGNGLYLALLDHAYYNIKAGTMNDTFRAMLTYIMGNDLYLTFTPSFSFDIIYTGTNGVNPRANDAVITLSYGSPGGANPSSVLASTSSITAALSFTLPFSKYSRDSSLITSSSLSVSYVNVFNSRRTSISIGPNIGYNFRRNMTSAPTVTDASGLTDANSFEYMGNVYEKLIPYSEMNVGLGINTVHTIMQMTYLIGWVSVDSIHYYDDTLISNGQSVVVTPSTWTSSATAGGKIFFPMFGYLWGDLSVSAFMPFNGESSYTAAAGLSYFF